MFYPILNGLELGRRYKYSVFDGETLSLSTVVQKAISYETSHLYDGPAYKIKTTMHGQKVHSWFSPLGRPVLEMAARGLLISAPESRRRAKQYLTEAAFGKDEALLEYCLIKTDKLIKKPRQVSSMQVVLYGIDRSFKMPESKWQTCIQVDNSTKCIIERPDPYGFDQHKGQNEPAPSSYLQPSLSVTSGNHLIKKTAGNIVRGSQDDFEKIERLLDWIQENIEKKAVDAFTAADVLDQGQAECQGHAYLTCAFMRASGIASRVINGIVYSKDLEGFMYHTWVEAWVAGHWLALDPVFRQFPADATHLKLVEGEDLTSLVPLVDLIGRLKIEVLSFR